MLDNAERMRQHADHRDRVFMKPRPLEFYTDALQRAGLSVTEVREKTIEANVSEWFELMTAYHESVLGWVGGTKRLDGAPPTPEALDDPDDHHAPGDGDDLFAGRETFQRLLDLHQLREADGLISRGSDGLISRGLCCRRRDRRSGSHRGPLQTGVADRRLLARWAQPARLPRRCW